MKKKRNILLAVCAGLMIAMSSCENEIPFHTGDFKPRLTLNGFIYIDSLNNSIALSLSGERGVTDAGDVTVEVYVNNELKETVRPIIDVNPVYRFAPVTTRFRPGDVVRIDAITDDGAHHAWIEETVPVPVQIEQVDTTDVTNLPYPSVNPYKRMRVRVKLKDRPGEKNYYRILIEKRDYVTGNTATGEELTVLYKYFDFWPWDDIALTDGSPATSEELDNDLFERVVNKYGVFDDSWFRDSEYTLNLQVDVANWFYGYVEEGFIPKVLDVDMVVRLHSITEAEYYYLNTLNIIDSDVLEDYISDPVKIPGNVNGGAGFIGISSGNSRLLHMVKGEKLDYYY